MTAEGTSRPPMSSTRLVTVRGGPVASDLACRRCKSDKYSCQIGRHPGNPAHVPRRAGPGLAFREGQTSEHDSVPQRRRPSYTNARATKRTLGDLGKRLVEPVEGALVEPGARAGFAMFAGPLGRLEGQRGLAAGEPVVEVAFRLPMHRKRRPPGYVSYRGSRRFPTRLPKSPWWRRDVSMLPYIQHNTLKARGFQLFQMC